MSSTARVIFPTIIGNMLEWYDFTLYAYFATIFAKLYFPPESAYLSQIEVYGLFAASYIMRPVGAMVFGYIGDTYGRKYSLVYSIIIMGLCSLSLSLLPTYAHWGVYASIALVFIRLLQGFGVGGEYSGASIFLIESAPKNRRSFFGSLALASAYSGFVLSASVGTLLSAVFTQDQLSSWGWRFGFLFGGFIALIGFYIRNQLKDTLSTTAKAISKKINPLKNLLYLHPKTFLLALGVAILPAGFSYMVFVFFSNFLTRYSHYSSETILAMNMLMMIFVVLLIPFIGLSADYIGRRIFMIISACAILIFCIPLFHLLLTYTLIILLIFALLNVLYEANIPTEIAEMFPADYRYSGLALTLNLTNGIAGGFAPIIATYLIHATGKLVSPMYYIIGLGIISLLSLMRSRQT